MASSVRVGGHDQYTTGRPPGRRRTWTIKVGSGRAVKHSEIGEPAGVIRLLRITVPHGTRATLIGLIPHLAGISISTSQIAMASKACWRYGLDDVCAQAEEACPMPAATWRFELRKLAGPAGEVRLDFIVG